MTIHVNTNRVTNIMAKPHAGTARLSLRALQDFLNACERADIPDNFCPTFETEQGSGRAHPAIKATVNYTHPPSARGVLDEAAGAIREGAWAAGHSPDCCSSCNQARRMS